jgi:hypothetical protein
LFYKWIWPILVCMLYQIVLECYSFTYYARACSFARAHKCMHLCQYICVAFSTLNDELTGVSTFGVL